MVWYSWSSSLISATRLVCHLVSELYRFPPWIDRFRGAVATSPVSGGRMQPLEVIDVVLNSSGSIVCDFVIGWVVSCWIIIVFIPGDTSCATIVLRALLRCRQGAQFNHGIIKAWCFAAMMLRYRVWRAVFWIVDSIVSCVRKGVKTRQLVIPWAKRIRLLIKQ